MYAYVKLINSGKFPSKVFEVKIKDEYHKCLIGLTNESKEGLADQINKGGRVRFPPAALLSDLSEIDEKTCPKEKKSVVEDNTRDILNKKLSAINKMLRLNNRLLNSSCDESSVSKRTVYRWKQIFADTTKEKKIDIFSYYLKEAAQFDKDKHEAQMKQFYNYVSSKITDTRAEKKRPNEKKLPKVKPVESSDTEDISDIEEDTIASNGEEDSGESTDEVSDQEFDNAMIQEREEEVEKTDVDHEAEPTAAIVNTIEKKSIEERKEESEHNNSFNPNNSEEKVTDKD